MLTNFQKNLFSAALNDARNGRTESIYSVALRDGIDAASDYALATVDHYRGLNWNEKADALERAHRALINAAYKSGEWHPDIPF